MPFQRFDKIHSRFENRITVTKSRGIGLPTEFFRQHAKQYSFAVLYFDPDQKAIGIRFTNEDEPGKFSIMKSKNYGGHISAGSFFKNHKIDPVHYYGRYSWDIQDLREAGLDEDGEMYVIKLKTKEQSEGGDMS